jgi:AraC-like DNA-binding protein
MDRPFAYREYYTAAPLSELVRKFWVLDNAQNAAPVTNQQVLPNSCFNLAYVRGQGLRVQNRRGQHVLPAASDFCGQARGSVEVVIQPFTHVTLAQLHPWALAALTPRSLADTADALVPLTALLPELAALELPAYALAEDEPPGGEAVVMRLLETKLPGVVRAAEAEASGWLRRACQRLQQANGCLRIADLAQELGCSTRQVEKQFRHGLGLTPKEFATVLRVRGVVDALQAPGLPQPLAQVALAYGFYDQAHFIRTFGRLVQRSPGRFNKEEFLLPLTGRGYGEAG